jgi:eukaryotic-like serine/threonine-protein kinase
MSQGGQDDPTTPLSRDATTPLSHPVQPLSSLLTYLPNEILGGRYRIIRVAGAGGMGVVYEAEDLELHERVALKTLHAPQQAREQEIARLRREVQLSRRVTHPNVCRIYDAGRHDEVLFVTMELLDGETLSRYIATKGRLDESESIAILRQLCAGLQAAHDAGVIHRDFKSGNVMLVRRGSEVRGVITDFGLARETELDPAASRRSAIIGTPAYMAPEQIRGGNLTPAVDIYALGVVAFEMLTGEVPFAEGSVPSLVRRLEEPAPTPRQFVSDLDPRLESVILRCLERDPQDRFASSAEVARALDDGAVPVRRKTKRWMGIAAAIAVIAALGVGAFLWKGRRTTPEAGVATPKQVRRSVAILGFKNLAQRDDAAWLSTALAEMLATELAAAESLRVIPGEETTRAKRDLQIADVDSHTQRTLARFRSATGADFVVLGSYLSQPDKSLRVDIRVQRTAGGDSAASFVATGTENDLFALIGQAGATLRDRLGADARLAEGLDLRRAVPVNATAARHFAEGVARLHAYEAIAARDALEKAVQADTQFALAFAQLADAYGILGFDEKAASAARRAFELSGRLPRSERLLTEATYYRFAHQLEKAIGLYRALIRSFPDDPQHRVRLIDALIQNSRAEEALKEIAEIRKLRGAFDVDPRVDLLEAWTAEVLGDHKRILDASDRAIAKARAAQNRDVLAESLVMRGWALSNFSKMPESLEAFDEAVEIFTMIGNRAGVGKSLRKRSFVNWRRGELDEARRLNERALKIYREVGQQQGTAGALGGLGVLANTLGQYTEARNYFRQALEIYRRIGDRQNTAWAIASIAGTHVLLNELDEGLRGYEEALVLSRQIGDQNQIGTTLTNIGMTSAAIGDLAKAERCITEALEIFRKGGDRSSAAYCDGELGTIALRRGDLAKARVHHERAIAERRATGETAALPENQLLLSLVSLEEGNPTGALADATTAASEFETEERASEHAAALVMISRANEKLGRAGEARAAITAAKKLLPKVQDPKVDVAVALQDAVLASDVEELDRLAARTLRERMIDLHYDARLAAIEADVRAGRRERARTRAAELARDAKGRGYGLVERKSLALLK